MSDPGNRSAGRRIAATTDRLGPMLLTALGAVLVAVVALALMAPARDQPQRAAAAPEPRPLVAQVLGCPSAAPSGGAVLVASAAEDRGRGRVVARAPGRKRGDRVALERGDTTTVGSGRPVVLDAAGSLAPGLFGARTAGGPRPAVGECVPPSAERWYAGLGAGGTHTSRLELVNPDPGPAVAEVTLWSTDGPMDRVESRGLTVPGRAAATLDLAEVAPHREELVMRVRVERGRLTASVADAYAPDGTTVVRDWLPATAEPGTELYLPGLPRVADEHALTLVNTGEVEGRVAVQVAGKDSTFTPTDLPDIRVPPGRVVVTDLTEALAAQLRGEDAALRLTATVPVVAGLRATVAGDLAHLSAVAPQAVDAPRAAVLPAAGRSVVVLAGADRATRVRVSFPGAGKKAVPLRLRPDRSHAVPVPAAARAVVVSGPGSLVAGVRTVAPSGAVVTPLRPLAMTDLVPEVRPARP